MVSPTPMTPEQQTRLAVVETNVAHVVEDVAEIKADVKSLLEWAATVRGGQKVALGIASTAGALVAVVAGWGAKKLGLS